ncbi:hypothetical protein [Planococcus sp. NCCP-2050]|nr:hypothetical protein [Planococcus sp. NCCP-2050]GKW47346.1 hypothetical protein NCCP2050_30380 [Planococcus sp. NCCP-2050]
MGTEIFATVDFRNGYKQEGGLRIGNQTHHLVLLPATATDREIETILLTT